MHDLSAFQRDLLYIVAELGSPNGLAIKRGLEEYSEDGTIHDGQLYPNIDTLIDKGMIQKWKQDGRTNNYALTKRAHRELEYRRNWENEYIDGGSPISGE